MEVGGVADLLYPSSTFRRGRVQGEGKISPTILTTVGICKIMDEQMVKEKLNKENVEDYLVNGYGVFKLSPRECLRLQNVAENDIDKMMAVNSNTRCYMQAGNSICVSVLMAIFSQLNIKGVTPWNELTDEQRYELIYKGCVVQ
jgi:DNA (cytosine-5)-methyltransferase 1